ncbi:histidine kinase HHK3 [Stachybotrys elegans]|uniref:histidine kinase n=1 Tax=Stachybotrys elegans TaxID=80388 RepID=A0A8K0WVP0_9HYPO|nr:histidine kinase HHK3 [Stachybotrys elegans]
MLFFPRADAALLTSHLDTPSFRPTTVAPVYDPEHVNDALEPWSQEAQDLYPSQAGPFAKADAPSRSETHRGERYLRAFLSKHERLRLSMLWYYTRDIHQETELLSGLQQKVRLAQETTGWECAIVGTLDVNVYTRLATVGTPLGILPRGETICAHTVTQPPGSVFLLPNLLDDWRFQESPYVESGGLKAYAGAPLRLQNEAGVCVSLGSFCVASKVVREPLTKTQQQNILHLADWVVSDIVQCARARRQRQRRQMADLLAQVQAPANNDASEAQILGIMKVVYPEAQIALSSCDAESIEIEGKGRIPLSKLQNGLWEDGEYIDEFILKMNQHSLPKDRVVRVIAVQCESRPGLSFLSVATKDVKFIFDDVDLWFVQMCANLLSQIWHKLLLADVMRAKDKFLRGFSHQLRTPLHGILGSVELLAEELVARETILKAASDGDSKGPSVYLDTIKRSGRDLISIVNSIITLNRWADIAMQDRCYDTRTISDLESALVSETRQAVTGDSRYQASVFFRHDTLSGHESLRTDHSLLCNSVLPLIVNAVQNTEQGIVMVTISMDPSSRDLIIDVEDSGCGIHPDDHRRIFDAYEKVVVHSTGAGLGLTLASKFATLINGSIALVSSRPGGGSHFKAAFQGVYWTSPSSPVPEASLGSLPSKFYKLPVDPQATSLSDQCAQYLLSHGLVSSETIEECLVIIDYVADEERRLSYLSRIPQGQVALCLLQSLDMEVLTKEAPSNVVYVNGPFHSSSIQRALAEADERLSAILAGQTAKSDHEPEPESAVEPAVDTALTPDTKGVATELPFRPPSGYGEETGLPTPPPSSQASPVSNQDIGVSPSPPSKTSPPKPKALLVDDNSINLRIMEMYCAKRGLPFCCAADGQQAVEIFTRNQSAAASGDEAKIQLILMDLQMPVCDGLEATKQIRSLEACNGWDKSTLFIVTGQDDPSDRDAAASAGADDYFVKPLSIRTLDMVLRSHFSSY